MRSFRPVIFVFANCLLFSSGVLANGADRYDYCRDQARESSGYFGAVPAEYEKRSGIIEGAIKGAAAGAVLGWVAGSDERQSARKGAKLGALFSAIQKASQNKKAKENAKKRRRYERELHSCMSR